MITASLNPLLSTSLIQLSRAPNIPNIKYLLPLENERIWMIERKLNNPIITIDLNVK